MNENESRILPQDEEGRENLRERLDRAVSLMHEIDGLKADIKELAEEAEECNLTDKKNFMKLVKVKYKENVKALRLEAEELEGAIEILYGEE